jgi:hypothetical protein
MENALILEQADDTTEHTAGMPENERKRYATRAVDDLMKNFD